MPAPGRPVPPPPYFHGSRAVIEIGDLLRTREVNPNEGEEHDPRLVAWASATYEKARAWALRVGLQGDTAYVYEVEMDRPEVDPNWHRPGDPGPYVDVMAPTVRVVRVVSAEPVRGARRDRG